MFGKPLKLSVAALAAAVALAGCGGGPVKMGAAALVGDDRITVGTLDRVVQDWQKQFKTDQIANQMRSDPSGQQVATDALSESDMRDALAVLVNFRVAREMAARNGVTVTEGRIEQVVGALDQRGGAASTTLANGLPRAYTRDLARFLATHDLFAERFGADADPRSQKTAQAQQQASQLFVRTAHEMDIEINPRFGAFDPSRVVISPATAKLSATEPGVG